MKILLTVELWYVITPSSLVVEVKSNKHLDPLLMKLKKSFLGKMNESFFQEGDGVLRYQGRMCVPNVDDLRNKILYKFMEPVTLFIRVLLRCTIILERCFGGMS